MHTVHSASDLTRLLVAPTDRSEVGLVVHEPGVEVGLDIWVGGPDVDLATARGIFLYSASVPIPGRRRRVLTRYWNLRTHYISLRESSIVRGLTW